MKVLAFSVSFPMPQELPQSEFCSLSYDIFSKTAASSKTAAAAATAAGFYFFNFEGLMCITGLRSRHESCSFLC